MATIEDFRSSTPAPLRVIKRPSTNSLLPPDSSEASIPDDGMGQCATRTVVHHHEGPLTVRKRGQQVVSPVVRRAPALERLLRPERSYIKLPAAQAREDFRARSNGVIKFVGDGPGPRTHPEHTITSRLLPDTCIDVEAPQTTCQLPYDHDANLYHHLASPKPPSRAKLTLEPAVLVPVISVTPEIKSLGEAIKSFWSAIEVSRRIRRPDRSMESDTCWERGGILEANKDPFQFGCLRDLHITVTPRGGARITNMLQEEPPPSSLDASSTILLLVQVHIASRDPRQTRNASFSTISDELIEDLEQHLGTSSSEYLHVQLRYSHPAFSSMATENPATLGMSPQRMATLSVQTRLETNVIASIRRNHHASQWSPQQPSPVPNPLFRIVATHWDPQRAADAVHRILGPQLPRAPQSIWHGAAKIHESRNSSDSSQCSQINPNCSAQWRSKVDSWKEGVPVYHRDERRDGKDERSALNVIVPQRKTSLQKHNTVRTPEAAWLLSDNSTPRTSGLFQDSATPSSSSSVVKRSPKTGSTPRVFHTLQSRTSGVVSRTNTGLKENHAPKSQGSPSMTKKGSHLENLEEFGSRPRTAKATTFRKPSVGRKVVGRWAWASWW